jgi:hypothetical protein
MPSLFYEEYFPILIAFIVSIALSVIIYVLGYFSSDARREDRRSQINRRPRHTPGARDHRR